MNHLVQSKISPTLPTLLATPFKLIPGKLHSKIMPVFLNKFLSQQITDGDLDFLENRHLSIKVTDTNTCYNLSFSNGRLIDSANKNTRDATIQASLYDFLRLAARQQDPDTLMFQRRLIMQGDTELGLELKNFLDGLDLESNDSFNILKSLLEKSLPVYKRLFS